MEQKNLQNGCSPSIEPSKGLATLAFLEANLKENTSGIDRIALFQPLVNNLLNSFSGSTFSSEDVQKAIVSHYGILLPQTVINVLLNRCMKRNLIMRSYGRYKRTSMEIPYTNTKQRVEEIEIGQKALISDLIKYAESNNDEQFSEDEVKAQLVEYLEHYFLNFSIGMVNDTTADCGKYQWIHTFFYNSKERNADSIELASTLVRGIVIYNAAFLPGFTANTPTLKGLFVYFDSALVCKALGYETAGEKEYVTEALSVLREAGAICRILEPTVAEIKNILYAVFENYETFQPDMPPNSFGYCLHQQGFEKEDILQEIGLLEENIERKINLRIEETPERDRKYVGDENALGERLADKDKITDKPRIRHDINCIAAVLTKRKGKEIHDVSKSVALFVTSSPHTLASVRKWWVNDEGRDDIAPIFSLNDLANYAWLRNPSEERGGLQREALISTCAAAMNPSEKVWRQFTKRLSSNIAKGTITEADAIKIISENDNRMALLQYNSSDEDNSEHVVNAAIEKLREDYARNRIEEVKLAYQTKELEYENKLSQRNDQISKIREDHDKTITCARSEIDGKVRVVINAVGIALLLLAVIAFASAFPIFDDGSFNNSAILSLGLSIVFGLSGLLSFLEKVRQAISNWISEWITPAALK